MEEALKLGMAGVTVSRGFLGFGANSGANRRIQTSKVLRLSEDLPVVVEIVDREDKIVAFLSKLIDKNSLLESGSSKKSRLRGLFAGRG